MNKDLKSSPFSLNNFNLGTSELSQDELSVNYDENIFSNSFAENTEIKDNMVVVENNSQKRLNDLDGNILGKVATFKGKNSYTFFEKLKFVFDNRKNNLKDTFPNSFNELVYFLFPSVDRSKAVRDSLKKLKKLNNKTHGLVTEKIPFGESGERYKELSDNITQACIIQANLKKKIN